MLDDNDPWVCLNDDEDDCVIERVELRVQGRKPLIINNPTMSKLIFTTKQFLHTNTTTTHKILKTSILDTPDPLTAEQHCRLVMALERHLDQRSKSGSPDERPESMDIAAPMLS
ncbi:hypothetical protein [Vibrio parahaemolyticus]|uniref:hypothetical protein n=1 Tax=Vibrio parahaemolyticus TaxID=670 RepID=UPI00177D0A55|nr:hypothetical protein [Vibrio parahaemolyticus]MBD6945061.1 hypothetical protein [Vibrio parahaemolyticus]MBD6978896.1 hypothetical protein [Vibrio parahaemolyticus]MBD6990963.1 hypothetical protein [Vibrio parahaemolyticus]WOZ62859.1 hypothetical protein RHS38_26270 [Vibrio parahaemolyticus]WOZ62952.1 hypothetical protein RHS38_26490 [Vibrio parahaemolyticus]